LNTSIIDTHAHLDMPEFDSDRQDVLKRASRSGVMTIVTIGIDLNSSAQAIKLAQTIPGVYATAGIHPQESKGIGLKNISQLEVLAHQPGVVALGEMGLDYHRDYSPKTDQQNVFHWQLELAEKTSLPIIIHCRQAVPDMLEILGKWSARSALKTPKGIIHCFSGELATAKRYIDMGFYIALGAYIGYPSSTAFREIIREIPLDRLVLETDCPFLPPQSYRGKRNEPAYTQLTLQLLSDIKGLAPEEVARQTTANALAVFRLSQPGILQS
jgi:TatD DNase family protein